MIIAGHNRFRACQLVPIRVGMILRAIVAEVDGGACPHTRGDDPAISDAGQAVIDLSPYAWG